MNNKIKDAWLDIDVDETNLFNPMSVITDEDFDEFHLRLTWLMGRFST